MPTLHGPWTTVAGSPASVADHRPCLGDDGLHQVAPGHVGRLERLGVQRRRGRVVGQQQVRGLERLPHPAGGVEPRRDGEGDGLEIDRVGRDPGPLEQGRDAGPRVASQPLEPEPRDRPVLADDRRHVGDRPDGRQVGEGRARRPARPVRRRAAAGATLNATPLPVSRRSG